MERKLTDADIAEMDRLRATTKSGGGVYSFEELGAMYGVSKQRAQQVISTDPPAHTTADDNRRRPMQIATRTKRRLRDFKRYLEDNRKGGRDLTYTQTLDAALDIIDAIRELESTDARVRRILEEVGGL